MKAAQEADSNDAKQALEASELRYRRLFETAKDGILILDAETGMVVDVNPFLIHLLGYSHEQFVGKAVWELGFFRDVLANRDKFLELQQQKYVRYEDLPLETATGRRIEVEFVSNVYWAGAKKVIQCNIRDITERMSTEANRALLATAVEQSAETIVITDASGTILYANPSFEKSSGYTRAESMGKNPRIFKSGKQDAEFYRRMWAVLEHGEVWTGHFINQRKDGTLYKEEASISPVRDAKGTIVNYVAAKRDVTHEEHLEDQLRQSQKMEAVGRLAGGVAHDFNNLLTAIMGYADLCLLKIEPGHVIREWLEEIKVEVKRSSEITRQLLAFARKQTIEPKVLDLNDAVGSMLKLMRRLIGEDIRLAWLPGAVLGLIRMDPTQVDQILANLCVNARDAIAGVGTIHVATENAQLDAEYCVGHADALPGDYVLLIVSDDGCGMDKETQSQIFEPFFTTKGLGKGTGLGLATVYGIVKQNNGHIWVYSEPGKGTVFKLYLPRVIPEMVVPGETQPTIVPEGKGETLLLVEDEKSLCVTCEQFLEGLGYHVLIAETPGEALQLIRKHGDQIRLMLTDVIMPGMDGKQLARRMGVLYPNIRVLFMSGYTSDVIAQRGVLDKNTNFLAKPFTRIDLAIKVHEMLKTP